MCLLPGTEGINVSGILRALLNTQPITYLLGYTTAVIAGFGLKYMIRVKQVNLDNFSVEV